MDNLINCKKLFIDKLNVNCRDLIILYFSKSIKHIFLDEKNNTIFNNYLANIKEKITNILNNKIFFTFFRNSLFNNSLIESHVLTYLINDLNIYNIKIYHTIINENNERNNNRIFIDTDIELTDKNLKITDDDIIKIYNKYSLIHTRRYYDKQEIDLLTSFKNLILNKININIQNYNYSKLIDNIFYFLKTYKSFVSYDINEYIIANQIIIDMFMDYCYSNVKIKNNTIIIRNELFYVAF